VGDLFDLVRSPSWLATRRRPYHEVDAAMRGHVDGIVDRILEREGKFFAAIRKRVQEGALRVHYVLGNHDRLLSRCPAARRKIWAALTGADEAVTFGAEAVFRDHGVLAYHGHIGDPINHQPEGEGTVGDAIGIDLIVRFPREVRRRLEVDHPELDDIDDVRPVYAVPAWVRQLGVFDRSLLRPASETWSAIVEDFLGNGFVRGWMRRQHRAFGFDTGKKLRLLLELSTGRVMARGHDQRLTKLYQLFQHGFDGRMARRGAQELARPDRRGLRYVVNGHSHFASMVPLGTIEGERAVYFNTGTWRTVHQIGHTIGGRPTFLPYDAMTYLVFFPDGDELGRDFEWWTGALVAR
jgi:UDP-2,3-diacylglucosamine pyrophosphatase LpxH